MREIVFCLLFLVQQAAIAAPTKLHAIGLLGEDYGILRISDFKADACYFKPAPFPPTLSAFPYWRCYEMKHLRWEFDQSGTSSDDPEGLPVLVAKENGTKEEYLFRRPWPREDFRGWLATWRRRTFRSKHVCISGSFLSTKRQDNGDPIRSWFFYKYKTRLGCDEYFGPGCDTHKFIRKNCPGK